MIFEFDSGGLYAHILDRGDDTEVCVNYDGDETLLNASFALSKDPGLRRTDLRALLQMLALLQMPMVDVNTRLEFVSAISIEATKLAKEAINADSL